MTFIDAEMLSNGWTVYLSEALVIFMPARPPAGLQDVDRLLWDKAKNGWDLLTEGEVRALARWDGSDLYMFTDAHAGALFALEDFVARKVKRRAIISKTSLRGPYNVGADDKSWEAYDAYRNRGTTGLLAPLPGGGFSASLLSSEGFKPPSFFLVSACDVPEDWFPYEGEGDERVQKAAAFVVPNASTKRGEKNAYDELRGQIKDLKGFGFDGDSMWLSYYPGAKEGFCPPFELAIINPFSGINWAAALSGRDPEDIRPAMKSLGAIRKTLHRPTFSAPDIPPVRTKSSKPAPAVVSADQLTEALGKISVKCKDSFATPPESPPSLNPDRAHLLCGDESSDDESSLSSCDEPFPDKKEEKKTEGSIPSRKEEWSREGLAKYLAEMGYAGDLKKKIFNRYCNGGMDLDDAIKDAVRSKNGGKDPAEKKKKKKTEAIPDASFLLLALPQTEKFNKLMQDGDWEAAEKHWKTHGKDTWLSKTVVVTNIIARLKRYIKDNPKGEMQTLLAWLKDRCASPKSYLKMLTCLVGLMFIDFEYGTYIDRNADEEDQ